jgi:rhodanese-related sulfurtransferase
MRSLRVAMFLESRGHGQVLNLDGGIDDWARSVDPAFPTY